MNDKVVCPHRGHAQTAFAHLGVYGPGPKVVHCNTDEGGCDEPFVADVARIVSYSVKVATIAWVGTPTAPEGSAS